jgi:hypothetical protein
MHVEIIHDEEGLFRNENLLHVALINFTICHRKRTKRIAMHTFFLTMHIFYDKKLNFCAVLSTFSMRFSLFKINHDKIFLATLKTLKGSQL